MVEAAIEIYSDAFVARNRHELDSARVVLTLPGVRGMAWIRLLITDDSGYDRLVAEAAGSWRGVVMVFEQAPRCHEFLGRHAGWSAGRSEVAMVLRDVQTVTGSSSSTPNRPGVAEASARR